LFFAQYCKHCYQHIDSNESCYQPSNISLDFISVAQLPYFKNDLKYTGKDYRAAFTFLEAGGVPKGLPKPLSIDMKALDDAEVNLIESGAIVKCPPLPGGEYSRADILSQTAYQCRAGTCTQRSDP